MRRASAVRISVLSPRGCANGSPCATEPRLGGVGRGGARGSEALGGGRRRGVLDRFVVRLRPVEAGVGGAGRGRDQDLVRAVADRALRLRERVGERGGLVDQCLDGRGREAPGRRAVVAGFERPVVGQRRAGVDLDVGLLEEPAHAPRETLAAAQHDGVGAEFGPDLRQQLFERAAAVGLGVGFRLERRIHVQFLDRH